MVNASEFKSKGKYINVDKYGKIPELKKTLIVIGVTEEEMQDGKEKLALCFDGLNDLPEVEGGLVLNQTNLSTMIEAKGEDTKAWIGAEVKLSLTPVNFAGKMTKSVVISSVN